MLRKLLLFVFLFGATTVVAQKQSATSSKATEKQDEPKIDYTKTGAPLPSLNLHVYRDSALTHRRRKHKAKALTGDDFDNGANLFVMIFNPNCSHCQDETRVLEKNISDFKKSTLLLVANPVMVQYLPDFYKNLHIADYSSICLGFDSSGFVPNLMVYKALPQINIYNSDRILIKTFSGETPIDSLQQYIQ